MSRSSELLKLAAEALDNGDDPFHESFLCGNEVTLDECFALAGQLALGAQVMAWAIENPKKAAAIVRGGMNTLNLEMVTDLMAKINLGETA
jgi:hypothetical protein